MSRFNKVHARVWNDEKSIRLSDRARLAFLFVMTHPHLTAVGALRHTLPGMAAELRWTKYVCRKAFTELSDKGLIRYSDQAALVWIPNHLRDYPPESPQVVTSWSALLDILPECELRNEMLVQVTEFVTSLGEAFQRALPAAFRLAKLSPHSNQQPSAEVETAESQTAAGSHSYEAAPYPATGQVPNPNTGQFASRSPPAIPQPPSHEPSIAEMAAFVSEVNKKASRKIDKPPNGEFQDPTDYVAWQLQESRDRLASDASMADASPRSAGVEWHGLAQNSRRFGPARRHWHSLVARGSGRLLDRFFDPDGKTKGASPNVSCCSPRKVSIMDLSPGPSESFPADRDYSSRLWKKDSRGFFLWQTVQVLMTPALPW